MQKCLDEPALSTCIYLKSEDTLIKLIINFAEDLYSLANQDESRFYTCIFVKYIYNKSEKNRARIILFFNPLPDKGNPMSGISTCLCLLLTQQSFTAIK